MGLVSCGATSTKHESAKRRSGAVEAPGTRRSREVALVRVRARVRVRGEGEDEGEG